MSTHFVCNASSSCITEITLRDSISSASLDFSDDHLELFSAVVLQYLVDAERQLLRATCKSLMLAISSKSKNQLNITEYGAAVDAIDVCLWGSYRFPITNNTVEIAAMFGSMGVLKSLAELGVFGDSGTLVSAALGYRLDILAWLRSRFPAWGEWKDQVLRDYSAKNITWAAYTIRTKHTQPVVFDESNVTRVMDLLKEGPKDDADMYNPERWARRNNCDLDDDEFSEDSDSRFVLEILYNHAYPWDPRVCTIAANRGNLDLLRLAREGGCPYVVDDEHPHHNTSRVATQAGHRHIIEYMYDDDFWFTDEVDIAASRGNLPLVKFFAEERDMDCFDSTVVAAARSGSVELLEYLIDTRGCPGERAICAEAADHGRLEVLEWARRRNYPWPANGCTSAIIHGHYECALWMLKHGCPRSDCTHELVSKHLYGCEQPPIVSKHTEDVIKLISWISACADPWREMTWELYAMRGQAAVLDWALTERFEQPADLYSRFIRCGQVSVLEWLKRAGFPKTGDECLMVARLGHGSSLRWLVEQGYTCGPDVLEAVRALGCPELISWIAERII